MATLTALKFDTPDGAGKALSTVESLSKQYMINLYDAAVVAWEVGKSKPKTYQLHDQTGSGAGWGALWGLLFGLIFFVPILGVAVGAGIGALIGSDAGYRH